MAKPYTVTVVSAGPSTPPASIIEYHTAQESGFAAASRYREMYPLAAITLTDPAGNNMVRWVGVSYGN